MTTMIENVSGKLTKDEAHLAAGIGANLAADLTKAIESVERGMQGLYTPIVAAVKGRPDNMARAILRQAKTALEAAGKPVGTVAQICTVVMWHHANGDEFPKKYNDARTAYNEKPKAGRKPRQNMTGGKETTTETGLAVVGGGVEVQNAERRQLLSQINAALGGLSEDDLTTVALFVYELVAAKKAAHADADAVDDQVEAEAA